MVMHMHIAFYTKLSQRSHVMQQDVGDGFHVTAHSQAPPQPLKTLLPKSPHVYMLNIFILYDLPMYLYTKLFECVHSLKIMSYTVSYSI